MGRGRRKKYDKMMAGVVAGLAVPMVIFLSIYFVRYTAIPLFEFFVHLWKMGLTFKILSLCGFANLAIFFIYLKFGMEKGARGVLLSTFIYALLFVIFELLM